MPTSALIGSTETARRLGCDVRTVHRMVRAGRLTPRQKLPGRTGSYIFDAADIDVLLATASEHAS